MESVLLFLFMNLFGLERFSVVDFIMVVFRIALFGNNAHNFFPNVGLHSVRKSFLEPALDGFLRRSHFVEAEALERPSQ